MLTLQVNLVRCSLAAVLVSVIDKMTKSLGFGWAYTLLGGLCILLLPLMFLEMKIGPKCRIKRKLLEDGNLIGAMSGSDVEN